MAGGGRRSVGGAGVVGVRLAGNIATVTPRRRRRAAALNPDYGSSPPPPPPARPPARRRPIPSHPPHFSKTPPLRPGPHPPPSGRPTTTRCIVVGSYVVCTHAVCNRHRDARFRYIIFVLFLNYNKTRILPVERVRPETETSTDEQKTELSICGTRLKLSTAERTQRKCKFTGKIYRHLSGQATSFSNSRNQHHFCRRTL